MAWFAQQVYLYSKNTDNSNTWSATPVDLSDYSRQAQVIIGWNGYVQKKDSFSFILDNPNNKWYRNAISTMHVDDKVRIWFKRNSSTMTASDLIMDGVISKITYDNQNRIIKVSGGSFVERLFAGQVFVVGLKNTTADGVIREVIRFVDSLNKFRPIKGSTLAEWNTIGNAITSKPFNVDIDYKMAMTLIDLYSSNDYTGNGPYIYYVQPDGSGNYNFIWKARDFVNQSTITEGTTENQSMNMTIDNSNTISFIIYKCQDVYGNGVWYPNFNASSINAAGGITKLIDDPTWNITPQILLAEFNANPSSFASTTVEGGVKQAVQPQFPLTYNYTLQFADRDSNGNYTGGNRVTTNNSDFNSAILKEARWRGYAMTIDMLNTNLTPAFSAEMVTSLPTAAYASGNIHYFNVPDFNMTSTSMVYGGTQFGLRIQQLTYTIDQVDIEFEKDPEVVTP
jgi:hypothetical protein